MMDLSFKVRTFENETAWLEGRKDYLTASDAANYCAENPFDPNGLMNLYLAKIGVQPRPYIGNKPQVIIGNRAEDPVRQLFMLQHPELDLDYNEFGLVVNPEIPWGAATLDGLLIDNTTGDMYIYEGKTTTVRNKVGFEKWYGNGVPENYKLQGSHQLMLIPEAKGIYFFCWQMVGWDMDSHLLERYYSREDLEETIELCKIEGQRMAYNIANRINPIQKIRVK